MIATDRCPRSNHGGRHLCGRSIKSKSPWNGFLTILNKFSKLSSKNNPAVPKHKKNQKKSFALNLKMKKENQKLKKVLAFSEENYSEWPSFAGCQAAINRLRSTLPPLCYNSFASLSSMLPIFVSGRHTIEFIIRQGEQRVHSCILFLSSIFYGERAVDFKTLPPQNLFLYLKPFGKS